MIFWASLASLYVAIHAFMAWWRVCADSKHLASRGVMDFQAAEITRLGKLNNRLREDYEILAGKYDIENAQLQYELKKNNGELQELKYKMEDLKKMKYRGTT